MDLAPSANSSALLETSQRPVVVALSCREAYCSMGVTEADQRSFGTAPGNIVNGCA